MKLDVLGREIKIDDYVTYEGRVYRVVRFTLKMVSIVPVINNRVKKKDPSVLKYNHELTLVPEADVMFWLLKQPSKK